MKNYNINYLTEAELELLFSRPLIKQEELIAKVKVIVDEVKFDGLTKAIEFAELYDGFRGEYLIKADSFPTLFNDLEDKYKAAIDEAYSNIYKFHVKQKREGYKIETLPGVKCSRKIYPIQNVGLYIPGGTAVLPSTVLMLGIPAQIAGCKRIVLSTPVKEKLHPAIAYAAYKCGVTEILTIGGAQGVALMAYGDKQFRKVDKIFGPGNQYVNAAKAIVSVDNKGCAIDMQAGPSEVMIIADESANPAFVAADLLSQLEHGNDSQAILLTTSAKLIDDVSKEIKKQKSSLKRKSIINNSIKNSFALLTQNLEQAFELSNNYAPEHLILNIRFAENYMSKIVNAGSVFLGPYSPESAGDYASGTNHSLPTYGYAVAHSGVSVTDFTKSISFQTLTQNGLSLLSETICNLAELEELDAHAKAVKVRLEND